MTVRPDANRLYELTLQAFEGTISDQDFRALKALLDSNPVNQGKYAELALLFTSLKSSGQVVKTDAVLDAAIWQALSDYERTAQGIEVAKDQPLEQESLDTMVSLALDKRSFSKVSMITTILSLAAVVFMFIYIRFIPPQASSVASLVDSIDARWADPGISTAPDTRLWGSQTLQLLKGAARIQFDYGAEVILEAPAEIELHSAEKMRINYGRLFAHVPEQATGFTVDTPTSKVIDIGTEFGIEVDFAGSTDVHMFKGRASLVAGRDGEKQPGMELLAGQARMVTETGQASEIRLKDNAFVRKLDSRIGLLWRGEALNLADIVGGGNGFGTGTPNAGVDAATGRTVTNPPSGVVQVGSAGYKKVDGNPFIDGVFTPGLETERTSLNADGSITAQFPRTQGNYWGYIFNGAFHYGEEIRRHDLRLNGKVFGRPETPAIAVHSNQGITFDLSAIRRMLDGGTVRQFRSLIGISETVETYGRHSSAVFWVFVDGKKVCEQKMSSSDAAVQLEIPIAAADRFLTLVVTESDDAWSDDWALFGYPELVIDPD